MGVSVPASDSAGPSSGESRIPESELGTLEGTAKEMRALRRRSPWTRRTVE